MAALQEAAAALTYDGDFPTNLLGSEAQKRRGCLGYIAVRLLLRLLRLAAALTADNRSVSIAKTAYAEPKQRTA